MTVQTERRGGVFTIMLDRPDAMNAVDKQLGADLLAALEQAGDPEVRAVVLTGNGRAFSSGADLKAGFDLGPDNRPAVGTALRERFHPIIHAIRELPKPVVAKVNGAAAGIGCSFALSCDLIVAAERAYFLLAFVNIGLVPDGGSSFLIPERVGLTRAAEMAMLGERIPARTALEWGLITRVVADDRLDAEVDALAERLAAGPSRSYAASKRQLNAWLFARMADQLELEATLQQEMVGTDDFVEGVSAFVQKRPPNFQGR
jgi:2-(1,2-epoxy-1,2-dihydrophenyl)acetyl-CoA isomerase